MADVSNCAAFCCKAMSCNPFVAIWASSDIFFYVVHGGGSALPLLGFSRICRALFDMCVSSYLFSPPSQLVCATFQGPHLQRLHWLLHALLVQGCRRMFIHIVWQTTVFLHFGSVPLTNVERRRTKCIFHDFVVPFLGPAFSHHFWARKLQT